MTNDLGKAEKSISGIWENLTAIQERNEKIDKDYIDGISVFKEQQKQLVEEIKATNKDVKGVKSDIMMQNVDISNILKKTVKNEKDNNDQLRALRHDLIEIKGKSAARVKYDAYNNNAAKRRTGTVFNRVHVRQYDAAKDVLKSYLSTIVEKYAVS